MPVEPTWTQHAWRAMGSEFELLVWGVDGQHYVSWAIDEVERLEQCWSRFRPASELSALNAASGRPFVCSGLLWTAIERAALAWRETGGLFDATIANALISLGYSRTYREIEHDGAPVLPAPVVGFGKVELDAPTRTVTMPAGVTLDLGGIGKGFSADILVAGMLGLGATSVMVSAGGDLRVGGPGPDDDDSWMTEVEHPLDGSTLARFPMFDEALVQSTTRLRQWRRGTRELHHLIDPRSGWPADTGIIAAVVTGPEAWRAEAIAKAALVAGEREGLALLGRLGHDGWLVRSDGTVVATAHVVGDVGTGAANGAAKSEARGEDSAHVG